MESRKGAPRLLVALAVGHVVLLPNVEYCARVRVRKCRTVVLATPSKCSDLRASAELLADFHRMSSLAFRRVLCISVRFQSNPLGSLWHLIPYMHLIHHHVHKIIQ